MASRMCRIKSILSPTSHERNTTDDDGVEPSKYYLESGESAPVTSVDWTREEGGDTQVEADDGEGGEVRKGNYISQKGKQFTIEMWENIVAIEENNPLI